MHHHHPRPTTRPVPLLIPLLAAAMFSAGARAEDYDDRFYFLPMGSYVLADGDRDTDDGLGATLAFGKRLSPQFELELRGSYLEYEADSPDRNAIGGLLCGLLPCAEPEDVEIKAIGAGASWFLSPEGRGLYLHGDAMAGDSTLLNAGLGYHFGSEAGWGLRLEALYHSDDGDYRETQFNLGLRIPIGSYAAPAEVVEPVQVVEPVEPPAPPPARCEMPSPGQPMTMDGCKAGDIIILRGVNFEFDKSTLTVNAKTLLDMVADALLARPDIKVEIDGHTDAKGSDEYNQKLSERRAQSVKNYLGSRGVDLSRMSTLGFGESLPLTSNDSDEGREINRRVELKVVESGGAAVIVAPPTLDPAPSEPAAPAAAPMIEEAAPVAEPAAVPPPAAAAGGAQVSIGMMVFEPATLTVPAGTTVTWTNNDGSNHNVSFPDQQSGRLKMGASWSRPFSTPGAYPYQCSIHGASMSGTVIVE